MKRLNTLSLVTIGLSIAIIIMVILIIRKISTYLQEKRKKIKASGSVGSSALVAPSAKAEYYSTASELAGLDVYGGRGDFTDYRPDEGTFARDPIDINVRADMLGGSGYETSGSSIFLDPQHFSIYQYDSDNYGLY